MATGDACKDEVDNGRPSDDGVGDAKLAESAHGTKERVDLGLRAGKMALIKDEGPSTPGPGPEDGIPLEGT